MPYFTKEEITVAKRAEIKQLLSNYAGRNVRDFFAASLVNRYHKQIFGETSRALTKICDLGAASGVFAGQLNQLGFKNIYGLDLDDYLSEAPRQILKDFRIADLSSDSIPWPENFFDIVTAWCVLPHLENPHFCIRQVKRVLKPEGLFILSIPHVFSRASVHYFLKHGDFARYHPNGNHISVFTPGVFKNTVLRHFEAVAMEYLIDPRSLAGFKGGLRRFVLRCGYTNDRLKNYLGRIWGYNQIWVLKKTLEPEFSSKSALTE